MDDGVNVVSTEAAGDVICRGDVAFAEREVLTAFEHFGVVQGGGIIEFIERNEVVTVFIGDGKGSDYPRTSVESLAASNTCLHEQVVNVLKYVGYRDRGRLT